MSRYRAEIAITEAPNRAAMAMCREYRKEEEGEEEDAIGLANVSETAHGPAKARNR